MTAPSLADSCYIHLPEALYKLFFSEKVVKEKFPIILAKAGEMVNITFNINEVVLSILTDKKESLELTFRNRLIFHYHSKEPLNSDSVTLTNISFAAASEEEVSKNTSTLVHEMVIIYLQLKLKEASEKAA